MIKAEPFSLGRHFLFLDVGTSMDVTLPCRSTTPQLPNGLS